MTVYVLKDSTIAEASDADIPALLAQPDAVFWVDMTGPTDEDMALMRDVFQFHPLAIEDTRNYKQRPKVEEYDEHLFIIMNTVAIDDEEEDSFMEVDVFVGEHFLVTVHEEAQPVIAEALKRLSHIRKGTTVTANYLFYVLFDVMVDSFFSPLDVIEEEIEELGDAIMENPDQQKLNRLFLLKRRLNVIWRAVWPQREVLNNLLHYREEFGRDSDLEYYMRDVGDHLMWLADMTNMLRDTVTGMMDLYMSATSNRLNIVVNRLTVFTLLIGVLTLFGGFYGMNFVQSWPPFEAWWSVPLVLGAMVASGAALLLVLRRLRWF